MHFYYKYRTWLVIFSSLKSALQIWPANEWYISKNFSAVLNPWNRCYGNSPLLFLDWLSSSDIAKIDETKQNTRRCLSKSLSHWLVESGKWKENNERNWNKKNGLQLILGLPRRFKPLKFEWRVRFFNAIFNRLFFSLKNARKCLV